MFTFWCIEHICIDNIYFYVSISHILIVIISIDNRNKLIREIQCWFVIFDLRCFQFEYHITPISKKLLKKSAEISQFQFTTVNDLKWITWFHRSWYSSWFIAWRCWNVWSFYTHVCIWFDHTISFGHNSSTLICAGLIHCSFVISVNIFRCLSVSFVQLSEARQNLIVQCTLDPVHKIRHEQCAHFRIWNWFQSSACQIIAMQQFFSGFLIWYAAPIGLISFVYLWV